MKQIFGIGIFLCLAFSLSAQPGRHVESLNTNWEFHKGDIGENIEWSSINLPHTWNKTDPFDDEPGYYRGIAWYKKEFQIDNTEGQWFLRFEGANQTAEVYVNDQLAGKHIGGYTAFNVPVSDFIKSGTNKIMVQVENSHNPDIVPIKGDFNFYGGIYRDVWLINTADTHFNLSKYGDQGIFITTPEVSNEEATIAVRLDIESQSEVNTTVHYRLYSPDRQMILKKQLQVVLVQGLNTVTHHLPKVETPELWHTDSPSLYQLEINLLDSEGNQLDNQIIPVGFRWFEFDANEGFFINGSHLKLVGSNRHQDYEGLGNALSDNRHIEDIKLIKDMGSNFFRTAHYPQDPAVLRASDQLGLLVSMEIPLDHDITDSKAFYDNSEFMMQEMIRQYYNHPSVIIWAYMNEMLLGRNLEKDSTHIKKIVDFAQKLEDLTRSEDSTRYTMIPNHGALELYHKAGLTQIPMLVGWNLYFGWYESELGGGGFLDDFHKLVPDKPVLVTEYGAGADPRIRSFNPERFDFSIEWQTKFHQQNLKDIMSRPYVAATAIWNIADFGSEGRNDAVPKINSKGVVSTTRMPKDAYYLYQSWLKTTPFVKIGGCDWSNRQAYNNTQPIEVFSNGENTSLLVNGQKVESLSTDLHLSTWQVEFEEGTNTLEARTEYDIKTVSDVCQINFQKVGPDWLSTNSLHINVGSSFYFIDPIDNVTWLPDTKFTSGTLGGFTAGKMYQPRDRGVGTDRSISNTQNDPVYQTGRLGGKYKFDLKSGSYELTFHWAETDRNYLEGKQRVFNVLANGKAICKEVNLSTLPFSSAFSKKVIVGVEDEGLEIALQAVEGDPIINGIEIRKL
ncbi:hypothetical protein E1176_11830 [Fulvivirga sp. RKSG066]|uniref:glycoside hydrolase family 2 TIM barrel-domain containing protein n=1 Tax=Fulvivirga aurantia TaxID=2529383 RepID=UPI0012BC9294|nr:glycoside hydrolase family 2 TIM barrel-domain containing protein [Fulvivirga aurantia]MTI21712.1 hypothetical protein [Fulvivirga aurantia]